MHRMHLFMLIASLIFLTSCAKDFKLVRFSDGLTLQGTANMSSKIVHIVMPDGEVMEGQYATVSNSSIGIGFGTGFFSAGKVVGTQSATTYVTSVGGSGSGYALLKGDKGTMMEIIFQFNPMDNTGFGEARTNKGEEYKVIF